MQEAPRVAVPAGPDGRGAQRAQTWFTEQNVTDAAENGGSFVFSVVVPTAELQVCGDADSRLAASLQWHATAHEPPSLRTSIAALRFAKCLSRASFLTCDVRLIASIDGD